jgi:hypothetical protein
MTEKWNFSSMKLRKDVPETKVCSTVKQSARV